MVEAFAVGERYTREQVAEHIGMPPERRGGSWATGYDEWNGQGFIFANVGIAGRTGHNYSNRWDGKNLIWSGKTTARVGQPQIDRFLSNSMDVHVFWRAADRSPFTYAGLGTAIAASNGTPVQVIWSFENVEYVDREALSTRSSPAWRRGPPPVTGEVILSREEGEAEVYLLRLDGPVDTVIDAPLGKTVIKIGMSGNLYRRIAELNAGFPPGFRVRWMLVRCRRCPTVAAAWELEGQYLEYLRRNGMWIGGEFGLVTDDVLSELLTE